MRPYLIRAVIDWVVDNGHTPLMVIDCRVDGVDAPGEHAVDGKLTLNISATATARFALGDQGVEVDCRFRGRPARVTAPIGAVVGVFAKETGVGMSFSVAKDEPAPAPPEGPPPRPKLTLVRG